MGDRVIRGAMQRAEHLQHAAGQIGAGWIGNGLDIGERKLIEPFRIGVGVEGGETAILRLHPADPVGARLDCARLRGVIAIAHLGKHLDDDRGIIHIGIGVVEELEGPSAGLEVGSFDRPVAPG